MTKLLRDLQMASPELQIYSTMNCAINNILEVLMMCKGNDELSRAVQALDHKKALPKEEESTLQLTNPLCNHLIQLVF